MVTAGEDGASLLTMIAEPTRSESRTPAICRAILPVPDGAKHDGTPNVPAIEGHDDFVADLRKGP